jgi:hypothetical protein
MTQAWHFVDKTLRDGRPIPADGVTVKYEGPIALYKSGLHASARILDALAYAPGITVCRVELSGEVVENFDKLAASERTILWRMDATDVLNAFARRCALDVIHLWDAPEIVRTYLETGDETLRVAARTAARVRTAARARTRAAARAAAAAAARAAADADADASYTAAYATNADVEDVRAKYNTWLEEMVLAAHQEQNR